MKSLVFFFLAACASVWFACVSGNEVCCSVFGYMKALSFSFIKSGFIFCLLV